MSGGAGNAPGYRALRNSATCGACVELQNRQNNRTVTITVVDSCLVGNNNPTCTQGHIDLSRAAFEQLTGQTTGDINNISWKFVPCGGEDRVQFQLKQPENQYWNQFIVLNHRYPIARAEVLMEGGALGRSASRELQLLAAAGGRQRRRRQHGHLPRARDRRERRHHRGAAPAARRTSRRQRSIRLPVSSGWRGRRTATLSVRAWPTDLIERASLTA